MRLHVVEGWTGDLDFQLMKRPAPTSAVPVQVEAPPDITGTTVALVVQDHQGGSVTFAGSITVPDPVFAKVRFSPAPGDLLAAKSPYNVRWKVTDAATKVVFFPSGKDDFWIVRPQ